MPWRIGPMSDFDDGYQNKPQRCPWSDGYKKGQDARDARIKKISTPPKFGGSGGGGCASSGVCGCRRGHYRGKAAGLIGLETHQAIEE